MKQPFNPCYELERFDNAEHAKEYQKNYRIVAAKYRRKFGKRFTYRWQWLESAWSFRYLRRAAA